MATRLLKNGNTAEENAILAALSALKSVWDSRPIAAYDLVMMCRDPKYRVFKSSQDILKDRCLMENDGTIHTVVRNTVLSAVEGEDLKMNLSFVLLPALVAPLTVGAPHRTNSQSAIAESPFPPPTESPTIFIWGSRMSKSQKLEERRGLSSLGKEGFSLCIFLLEELSKIP